MNKIVLFVIIGFAFSLSSCCSHPRGHYGHGGYGHSYGGSRVVAHRGGGGQQHSGRIPMYRVIAPGDAPRPNVPGCFQGNFRGQWCWIVKNDPHGHGGGHSNHVMARPVPRQMAHGGQQYGQYHHNPYPDPRDVEVLGRIMMPQGPEDMMFGLLYGRTPQPGMNQGPPRRRYR